MESQNAFCFCGKQASSSNSIEGLHTGSEAEWKVLCVGNKLTKNIELTGVEFQSKIVVFGGESKRMLVLNEEGGLVHGFSYDPIIPGAVH